MAKKIRGLRHWVQLGFTALSNGYLAGFTQGRIYTGKSKVVCLPGLNCYSCPGALGSCPIGSLQAVLNSKDHSFSFYIVGFLILFGAFCGRLICGWLCPFGLVQDLLHKIPFPKKLRQLPGEKFLRWMKYVILVVFVILLPLFVVDFIGQGQPWFCKYICPSGTLLAGYPLVASNEGLMEAIGWLFAWKSLLLVLIVFLSIIIYRPFCRYICPLGAIYGLFNPISLWRMDVNANKCTKCKKCQRVCEMNIPVYETPNNPECIRCGECKKACPHGAICTGFREKSPSSSTK